MLPGVEPEEDEILIPKTSCSVFNSTNIEYVLRNLGRYGYMSYIVYIVQMFFRVEVVTLKIMVQQQFTSGFSSFTWLLFSVTIIMLLLLLHILPFYIDLGVTQLMVVGMLSNQCVESAVRDAADRGFLVTLVEDAIAAYSDQEHQAALHNLKGFSRIVSHDKVVDEIQKWNNWNLSTFAAL